MLTQILDLKERKLSIGMICSFFLLTACNDVTPQKEDVPELITQAVLTFTPNGGGSPVEVTATDPDGEGVQDIKVDGAIMLAAGVSYTLSIELINGLAEPSSDEHNITKEVEKEGAEHMFFFGWTGSVFSDPAGNGNVDNRSDLVNYIDLDQNGLPLGLVTTWTAGSGSGTFRVVLKHQPDQKSATSTVETGETDLDITFVVNIQ